MKPHCKRKNVRPRQGAALVEFALVLPVMFLFFAAMVEFTRVLMLQHTADTAAYEAARAAMVPGATSLEAEQEADELLSAAGLKGASTFVDPLTITQETPFVTVRVEVPVAPNSWITSQFFQDASVQSEVTLLTERSPIVRLTGMPQIRAKKQKMTGPKPKI